MKNINLKKWLILGSTLLMFGVNMAASLLPLNNVSTKEISDSFAVYFVPAGYVFAIWGVIYVGMIAFSIYQLKLKGKEYELIAKLFPWVVITNVANALWLFTWHYGFFYSGLLLMLVLLLGLIRIYMYLRKAKKEELPKRSELLLQIPFSIYLGWITVATVANVTNILWLTGWNGFGIAGQVWAAILIMVAGALAVIAIIKHKDYAYASVIVWAVTGIAQKFPEEQPIIIAVLLVVLAIIVMAVYSVLIKKQKPM